MITIEVKVADPPENHEYTNEYRRAKRNEPYAGSRGFYIGPTFWRVLILRKIASLWVPPKGVFMQGWITRDGEETEFWWHEKDPNHNEMDEEWYSAGKKRELLATHPDNLPPLTIPTHLCKFRVGDE